MRILTILITALFATPALAHFGHIGEVAGHGHVIGAIAIGLAAGLAVLVGPKRDKDQDEEEISDEELQEA
jgi:hypothetical protein